MGRTLMIGQPCCYWSKNATKPLAAICLDVSGDRVNLAVFTAYGTNGGRFIKETVAKVDATSEGWTHVGEIIT